MLPLLVALVLGGLAFAFVFYPLYRHTNVKTATRNPATPAAPLNVEQAEHEQMARSALQEVELDFQLGNLAEPDYRSLRERYIRRAIAAMKFRQKREQELDEEIEAQLRRMKEQDQNAVQ